MKKRILVALLIAGFVGNTMAATLSGKHPVCTSKDSFERLFAAAKHNDLPAITEIMQTECFMPKAGLPVDKVVSMGVTSGVAQVKVYADGELFDLWANSESLKAD
ncbi:TPA: hypothetical protein ACJIYU_001828 [Yersinia enterocolitica]|uniref:hypothetical protein n=1 Tax=Yersinia enterocolitica TaxID=630 RepID=UPI0021E6E5A7|nr:hypothetical protein [Yersinia enterocolitica]UYK06087.1 hypothetical protein N4218_21625 [Yersinia enterocolitica]